MGIKLSHSGRQKWLTCGEMYRLHYIQKLRSTKLSSALLFGGAIDLALNFMLENKDNPDVLELSTQIFMRNIEQGQDVNRNLVDLPLNPLIEYFRSDYDPDLLEKEDWKELFRYDSNFFETKNEMDAKLFPKKEDGKAKPEKIDWLELPENDRMVYNYANWLCLVRKGKLFLEAYQRDILPKIKRVITVQKNVEIFDDEGNSIPGVIDFVAELQDGRVAVIDNKTSSEPYEVDSVGSSEQLAQYMAILNIFNDDPDQEWKTRIDCAVYAVMVKKLEKDITKTCKECGHTGQGSHKTCDNLLDKIRCNGEWTKVKKFNVITQFITGDISEEFQDMVLENATSVTTCISNDLFPRNLSACHDQYGKKCVYFSKCHKGKTDGLINVGEK